MSRHAADFMAAVRGIQTHHVVAAMNTLTPGTNWMRCSKSHMAEQFEIANNPGSRPWSGYPGLRSVDLEVLARRAKARAAGQYDWYKA